MEVLQTLTMRFLCFVFLFSCLLIFVNVDAGFNKYRICVTEKSNVKKYTKYCPLLEKSGSKASCVLGHSRLDCLRKIIEGKADFGMFQAEDIVVASSYKDADVLVTHEIIYLDTPYEYEMFAVVRKNSNITKISELQDKKLCHPGYGDDNELSQIVPKYFEARVANQVCDPDLSVIENHLKSSSQFFKAACKAGPWVPDEKLDVKLKQTYPNLCKLCDIPTKCSINDKYWGRRGPLFCLSDGAGDVAWAKLSDINYHFGLDGEEFVQASPDEYSFLCADDRLASLHKPENCAWVARPWPAVLTRRKSAEGVQKILAHLKESTHLSWQWALEELLEIHAQTIVPLELMMIPEDYLKKAPGFLSANNMAHCEPDGKIYMCVKSTSEFRKLDWMKRAAAAYGIEPQLECLTSPTTEKCLMAVQKHIAHVVNVEPDYLHTAYKEYGLKSLLYENSKNLTSLYRVAAVVKRNSAIKHIEDLKNKKACFPMYDGVGWNTILNVLRNKSLVSTTCSDTSALGEFFSESCVPKINRTQNYPHSLEALCHADKYFGEIGAFKCLATGKGDVAFIKLTTVTENTDGANSETWAQQLKSQDFRSICPEGQTEDCYLSWATPGQILINSNASILKEREIYIALMELGNLFGKLHKLPTADFQIFAPFDDETNILFQDTTYNFADSKALRLEYWDKYSYEKMIQTSTECSSAQSIVISYVSSLFIVVLLYIISA